MLFVYCYWTFAVADDHNEIINNNNNGKEKKSLTVSTANVRTGNFESIIKIKWKLLLQFICGAGWKRIKES